MKLRTISLLLVIVVASAVFTCSDDDCLVCPTPQEYVEPEHDLVYCFSMTGQDYFSYTFNTKTGEVVDSANYGPHWVPFFDCGFSSDGGHAYYTGLKESYVTWVANYSTGDTVSINDGLGGRFLSVSGDGDYIATSVSSAFTIFRLPDLSVVYTYAHHGCGVASFSPNSDVAYVPIDHEDSLLIVDVSSDPVLTSKRALFTVDGLPAQCVTAQVSPDATMLILTVVADTYRLQLRSAETLEILAEYPDLSGPYSLHPDGRRVFITKPHNWNNGDAAQLLLLDLPTRILREVLNGSTATLPDPYSCFDFGGMEIDPEGHYGYILNGRQGFTPGWILKLDLETYEVAGAIFPPPGIPTVMRLQTQ